jgi:hypothetical protein
VSTPAETIHSLVLQPMAVTQLQIEISRRLCEDGESQAAVAELDLAASQLQAAAAALHQLMRDLGRTHGAPPPP